MGDTTRQSRSKEAWRHAKAQHDVIGRGQLLDLGFSPKAIKHRVSSVRLHPIHRGVYAVGRPAVTKYGRWMAAVLACGEGAVLSHSSAAALWRIGFEPRSVIELSLPSLSHREVPELRIHRRPSLLPRDTTAE
jgi:hypothetical protein